MLRHTALFLHRDTTTPLLAHGGGYVPYTIARMEKADGYFAEDRADLGPGGYPRAFQVRTRRDRQGEIARQLLSPEFLLRLLHFQRSDAAVPARRRRCGPGRVRLRLADTYGPHQRGALDREPRMPH